MSRSKKPRPITNLAEEIKKTAEAPKQQPEFGPVTNLAKLIRRSAGKQQKAASLPKTTPVSNLAGAIRKSARRQKRAKSQG